MSCGMVAENSSVCRSVGSFATILRMSWMKPMSSMRSASSSTKISTPVEPQRVALHQVEQAAGRGDQHVDAVHQRAHLAAHRHAADGERRLRCAGAGRRCGSCRGSGRRARASGSAPARGRSCARDACGSSARRFRIGSAKAAVLPVPVCAMPIEVAALQQQRDGLGLDRGGGDVVLFGEGTGDRLCEAEVVKRVQLNVFHISGRGASHECGRQRNAGFKTSRVARAVR